MHCLAFCGHVSQLATSHQQTFPAAYAMRDEYCACLRAAVSDAQEQSTAQHVIRAASSYARFTWGYTTGLVQGLGSAAGNAATHLAVS